MKESNEAHPLIFLLLTITNSFLDIASQSIQIRYLVLKEEAESFEYSVNAYLHLTKKQFVCEMNS